MPRPEEPRLYALGDGEALRVIWKGDSEAECLSVCEELQKASIAYNVIQIPQSLDLRMAVNRKYEVGVRSDDYDKAREVVGEGEDWEDQNQEDQKGHATPEDSTTPAASTDSSYLKRWYPKDACVEVWAQSATDNISSMLELSFRENCIRFRSERQPDGSRRFFVLPEDEYRAREIVREIEESTRHAE